MESYLLTLRDFKLRRLLSRFRLSSHDLEIERGRYFKPVIPACQRLCKLCNISVENEEHVFMECKAYADLRLEFFNLIDPVSLSNLPTTFIDVMKCKEGVITIYTAKYLEKVFLRRSNILKSIGIEI